MAKNYDRERHRKDGQDQKVLGSPIFLIGIWLIYSIVVSYVVCWLASGISWLPANSHLNNHRNQDQTEEKFNSPEKARCLMHYSIVS